jgi:hypothetical protein
MRDYVDYLPDYMEVPTQSLKKSNSDSSSPEVLNSAETAKQSKEVISKVGDFLVLGGGGGPT